MAKRQTTFKRISYDYFYLHKLFRRYDFSLHYDIIANLGAFALIAVLVSLLIRARLALGFTRWLNPLSFQ
jgi:hypothetical protein